MKILKKIQLKIVIFTAVKNCCLLHGRVFVMIRNILTTTTAYVVPLDLKPQSHIHGFGPGRATVHPDLSNRGASV